MHLFSRLAADDAIDVLLLDLEMPGTGGPFDASVAAALEDGTLAPGVDTIVLKALEKSPSHRYQSAGVLAADAIRVVDVAANAAANHDLEFDVVVFIPDGHTDRAADVDVVGGFGRELGARGQERRQVEDPADVVVGQDPLEQAAVEDRADDHP